MFFLISSDKHFYCSEGNDLYVVDPSLVQVGDTVNFNFGSKSYTGNVLAISAREADILENISRRSKEKVKIEEGSFGTPGKKVRKSAKAQMQRMKEIFTKDKAKPEAMPIKKKQKVLDNEAKKAAEDAMEHALTSSDTEVSKVESDSDDSDDSSSSSSSLEETSVAEKNAGRRKDIADLRRLPPKSLKDEMGIGAKKTEVESAADEKKNGSMEDNETKEEGDVNIQDKANDGEKQADKDKKTDKFKKQEEKAKKAAEKARKREEKAKRKTDEKKRKEAEKNKKKADEKARKKESKKTEEKTDLEAEEKTNLEAEEKSDLEAEEKSDLEAEEKSDRKTEEKSDRKTEEKSDRKTEEKSDRKTEEKSDRKTEEKSDRKTEEKSDRKTEEKSEKSDLEAEEKSHHSDDTIKVTSDEEPKPVKKNPKTSKNDRKNDKKSKKRPRISSTSSTTSTSSDDYKNEKRARKLAKKRRTQRNERIYEGQNFRFAAEDIGVEKVAADFDVYAKSRDIEEAAAMRTLTMFIRKMVENVYSKEALLEATPTGFPPRGKGGKFYKKRGVPPRLHPDGYKAIFARAKTLEEENKTWRPKTTDGKMHSTFQSAVCAVKNRAMYYSK